MTQHTPIEKFFDPMTQHTPGPWKVNEGGKAVWADREYPKGSGVCVLVELPYYDGPEFPSLDEVTAANAHLIAAAPAQNEALRGLIDYMGWLANHGALDEKWLLDPVVNQARAAIAKAETS